MTFEQNVATNSMLLNARRANTKRGAHYQRVEFEGFKVVRVVDVYATRTTKNCIWFEDGSHIARDTGKVGKVVAQSATRVITYIPVQDANTN